MLKQAGQIAKTLWKQAVILYRQWFWQPSNWLNHAEKQCQLGDWVGAITSCEQAIKRDSKNYSAWYKKGQLLFEQQRNQEALSCFDQAIKIDSTSHTIWFDHGNVLLLLRQYDEALKSYNQAIKIKPNFYLALVKKGDILSTQKPRIAADCYEQALKINQNDSEVSIKLKSLLSELQKSAETALLQGNQYCEKGNFQEAIKLYDYAIELQPKFHEGWYQKGNVLAESQRYEEAINSYEKALQLKSDDYRSWVGKGNVCTKWQRYQEALNCYNEALRFKPNDEKILSQSEQVQTELNKLEIAAEKLLDQGINLYNMGQYEEAIKNYDQALEFISKNLVSAS